MDRPAEHSAPVAVTMVVLGVAACALAWWRGWSPLVWWVGVLALVVGGLTLCWRARRRRATLLVATTVLGAGLAAVPVVEAAVVDHIEVLWSTSGDETPETEAWGVDGTGVIVTIDGDQVVRGRDARDGTVLWQHEIDPCDSCRRPPIHVADHLVLLGARGILAEPDQQMVAVEATTGDVVWTTTADHAPHAHDSTILVAYRSDPDRGDVHVGIDMSTGRTAWVAEGSQNVWASTLPSSDAATLPSTSWLADPVPQSSGARYRVVEVATGEHTTYLEASELSRLGVVDDVIVLQNLQVAAGEFGPGAVAPATVTGHDPRTGDQLWQVAVDVPWTHWTDPMHESEQLSVIGDHYLAIPHAGATTVLDLAHGTSHQVTVPASLKGPATWSAEGDVAYMWGSSWPTTVAMAVDLSTATIQSFEVPRPPTQLVTITIDGSTVPAWAHERTGWFGRTHDDLLTLSGAGTPTPGAADLGALPRGTLVGELGGVVIVVESNDDGRTVAMHALAP